MYGGEEIETDFQRHAVFWIGQSAFRGSNVNIYKGSKCNRKTGQAKHLEMITKNRTEMKN